jgi:predicted transcriptional regulator
MTIQIDLTPEQQQWASEQVAQGAAASPEDAILEAVEIQRIRADVAKSMEDYEAGRCSPVDEAFDRVEKNLRKKFGS